MWRRRSHRSPGAITLADLYAADPTWAARCEAALDELSWPAEKDPGQQRLLDELAAVGVDINDVWMIGETPAEAVPVLVAHLSRRYPLGVRDGIARALGVPAAVGHWNDLLERWRDRDDPEVHQGVAVALSEMATRELLPEVRAILQDRTLGEYRLFFLRTLTRLRAPDGWELIAELADDPELCHEARHLLRQRELREAAKRRRPAH